LRQQGCQLLTAMVNPLSIDLEWQGQRQQRLRQQLNQVLGLQFFQLQVLPNGVVKMERKTTGFQALVAGL
jgi:outer membrane biogenesis lipoprotein LolB